jgi:hypothetical protein
MQRKIAVLFALVLLLGFRVGTARKSASHGQGEPHEQSHLGNSGQKLLQKMDVDPEIIAISASPTVLQALR